WRREMSYTSISAASAGSRTRWRAGDSWGRCAQKKDRKPARMRATGCYPPSQPLLRLIHFLFLSGRLLLPLFVRSLILTVGLRVHRIGIVAARQVVGDFLRLVLRVLAALVGPLLALGSALLALRAVPLALVLLLPAL